MLVDNESVLEKLHPSRWGFFWNYFFGVLTLPIIVGLILIIFAEIKIRCTSYYVTNLRVIYEYKFISRNISSTSYNKIQDIHFSQNILQRLTGIGTLEINTAGSEEREIVFYSIRNPLDIQSKIQGNIK